MRRTGGPTRLGRRALFGAAAGLLLPSRPTAARPSPLRVGALVPASGQHADLARAGAEIGAEILARRGRPLSLRVASASGAEAADRAATRLVEDGAEALLSACGEAETAAVLAVCERRGVPLIVSAANEPRLTDRGARMIVRIAPTTSQLLGRGLGLFRDLHERSVTPVPQRVALVHATDDAGTPLRGSLAAILPAALAPAPVLLDVPLPTGGEARKRLLQALRKAAADIIVVEATGELAASCVAAIVADGVRPAGLIAFGHPGLITPEVLALPDRAGDGHITFAPWTDPASPVTAEVRSLYDRRRPRVPFAAAQGGLALAVDSVLLLGEAAARNPAARGQVLAAALRGSALSAKMLRGPPLRFDQRGQNLTLPSVALQNRAGAPVVVLPRDWAEAEPVWPNPILAKS